MHRFHNTQRLTLHCCALPCHAAHALKTRQQLCLTATVLIRDWRERMIVEFRVLRKEKLRLVAEAIEENLRKAEEAAAAATAAATAAQSVSQAVVVEDDDDDDLFHASSSENSSRAAEGSQQGRGADRGALKASDGEWRPQVVVPLADADVRLQEPKFLKINTAAHSEL